MERIARALEIARQQRAAVGAAAAANRAASSAAAVPEDAAIIQLERPPEETRSSGALALARAVARRPDAVLLERHRIVTSHGHPAAGAYRMLRTQVLQRMRAQGKQVLAVASAGPGEGKTVTAVNLAIALAAEPKCTVVLVDLDLRRPAVGRYLGLEDLPGVDAWFRGRCEFAATTARILPSERLYVVPARAVGEGSSELLATDASRRMFELLRSAGPETIVICDVPPLFGADDLLMLAPLLDYLLLVVGERQTDRDELRRATGFIPGVPLLGTVLNKSREETAGDY